MDAGGPELAVLLGLCNSIGVLLICLPRSGGLWRLRAFGRGGKGEGAIVFCIITSLASGDVTVLHNVVIVVWVGWVETSFVRSMWP